MLGKIWFRLLVIIMLLGLAACSSGNSNLDTNKPITVNITASDYSFESSLTTFKVGQPYHFVVTNKGQIAHEIMIVQPIAPGEMDMEEMDELALAHIEEDDLQSGDTATMDYTFTEAAPNGTLEFSCYLPGHYEAGMKLPIIVN